MPSHTSEMILRGSQALFLVLIPLSFTWLPPVSWNVRLRDVLPRHHATSGPNRRNVLRNRRCALLTRAGKANIGKHARGDNVEISARLEPSISPPSTPQSQSVDRDREHANAIVALEHFTSSRRQTGVP